MLIYFQRLRRNRSLSVKTRGNIFVYNGHNFDAYEVLGLSKQTPKSEIQALFEVIDKSQQSDREFKLAAIKCLMD